MLNFQTQPIPENKYSELFFLTQFGFYKDVNGQHSKWIWKLGSVSLNHLLHLCISALTHPMRTQLSVLSQDEGDNALWAVTLSVLQSVKGIFRGCQRKRCWETHMHETALFTGKKVPYLLAMGRKYFFFLNFTLHKYFCCAFSFAEYLPISEYVPFYIPTQKTKLCTGQAKTLTLPTFNPNPHSVRNTV